MTTPIELIGKSVFLGPLTDAAWEVAKRAWEALTQKPLEELYVEAFQRAVDNARPRLTRHARDGEVELDQPGLRQVLRMDLGASRGSVSPSSASSELFLSRLARSMCERSVVMIGGHNLTHHEYTQLSYNLAREAATLFEEVVSRDERAFRSALLRETGQNRAAIEEIRSRLESMEDLERRLDGIGATLDTLATPSTYRGSALVGERIHDVEKALRDIVDAILTAADGTETSVSLVLPYSDMPPPPPAFIAPRSHRLGQLVEGLRSVTWVSLVDGPGKGKSQLARAAAEMRSPPVVCWVALRRRGGAAAEVHLETQIVRWLAQLKGGDPVSAGTEMPHRNLIHMAQLVSECTGDEGLLVVDDLPDSIDNQALFEQVCWIAAGLATNGATLLTTSQRHLPPFVEAEVGPGLLVTEAGQFWASDVLDMLDSAGAPAHARTDQIAHLIVASTHGHPSLIAASVAWLRDRGWSLEEDTLIGLLTGEPGAPVRQQERRRMLRLVEEPARQLLHRLSLVEEGFDRGLALRVSEVAVPIPDPGVLLDELRGPWLEQTEHGNLKVTALLRAMGRDNLPSETQKQVHAAVADHYLSQGTVDASQAQSVALHLWNAEQYQRFAGVLIQLMVSAQKPQEAKYILWAAALISPGMEWPHELNLDLRIMLRAGQVRTRLLAGRDASALDEDLQRLMDEAGRDNSWALLFACLNTGPLLPIEELPAVQTLLRAVSAVRLLRGQAIIHEDDLPGRYDDIIWLAGARLRGLSQVRGFLVSVGAMTSEERRLLFASELAPETMALAMDSVWNEEASRPSSERNWLAVMDFFDETEKSAREFGAMPFLVACARATAVVLADYLDQPDNALEVLQSVPEPSDADLSFLLHYTAGCILFDADRTSEALNQLDVALATPGDGFSAYRFHGQLYAAIADSKLGNWETAMGRCAAVIRLASQMPEFLTYERLETIGELAWVHWAAGRREKACAAMYGLVTSLSALDDPTDPRYRETFNKAGHALGWFCSVARTGQPPTVTASGDTYTAVQAGHFGVRRERIGAFTPPIGFSIAWLLTQMGALAYGVRLRRIAKTAYDAARNLPGPSRADQLRVVLIDTELAALCASHGDLQRAMDLSFSSIDGVVTHGYGSEGDEIFSTTADQMPGEDAPSLSPEETRAAEERLLLGMFIGPALTGLLSTTRSRDTWINILADLQTTVSERRHLFREDALAEKVLGFLNALVNLWKADEVPDEPPTTADDSFLKALWFLVASGVSSTRLVESLRMQVQAVDFLLRVPGAQQYLLPDVGAFIHRFWLDVANTRSFALNSPQLFREELRALSSRGGAKTAARVLLGAASAVGIRLPSEIRSRLTAV